MGILIRNKIELALTLVPHIIMQISFASKLFVEFERQDWQGGQDARLALLEVQSLRWKRPRPAQKLGRQQTEDAQEVHGSREVRRRPEDAEEGRQLERPHKKQLPNKPGDGLCT